MSNNPEVQNVLMTFLKNNLAKCTEFALGVFVSTAIFYSMNYSFSNEKKERDIQTLYNTSQFRQDIASLKDDLKYDLHTIQNEFREIKAIVNEHKAIFIRHEERLKHLEQNINTKK